MRIALCFHIIGIVMWLGGLVLLTRFAAIVTKKAQVATLGPDVQRLFKFWVLPGMLFVVGSGLHQLGVMGMRLYMKQAWFHGKMALVGVLLLITVLVFTDFVKLGRGESVRTGRLMMWHGITGMILVVVVSLTMIFR